MPNGKRPINASVRLGSIAHAINNAASTKSGTVTQAVLATVASTATARAIPSLIAFLLLAIVEV